MARLTQIERAIAALDTKRNDVMARAQAEAAAIDASIQVLRAQQRSRPRRKKAPADVPALAGPESV